MNSLITDAVAAVFALAAVILFSNRHWAACAGCVVIAALLTVSARIYHED